jgi:hypothetical protein
MWTIIIILVILWLLGFRLEHSPRFRALVAGSIPCLLSPSHHHIALSDCVILFSRQRFEDDYQAGSFHHAKCEAAHPGD